MAPTTPNGIGGGRGGGEQGLEVRLDATLPAALLAGTPTAVFCSGVCFHRRSEVSRLELRVDGRSHRATAWRMPRLALFEELHPSIGLNPSDPPRRDPESTLDPELRCYRSGFWGILPIGAAEAGALELTVAATLEDGTQALATVAEIEVRPREVPRSSTAGQAPRIVICMATFDPDEELFERQIDSIRAQTNSEWGCLISDDCSDPERFTAIERIVGDDRRFSISRSSERLGFYRNFERALSMVPAESELVALSDQDDYWYPDKLQALSDSIGGAELAYSDQRLVDRQGRVLRETLWQGRRNNYTSFASILIANTIVGAASMFRRELLSDALPFPEGPGWQFHDHWLAIVAMARGQVRYIDRPLYDYVQHAGAIVSRVGVEDELTSQRISVAERLGALRGLLSRWRPAYFRSYAQLSLQASVVLARCGRRMRRRERRAAVLLTGAEHSPIAFAWLLLRPLRALVGRTETLGSELHLVRGILWRWLIRIRVGRHRVPFGATYEAGLPPFDLAAIGQRRLRRWLAGD